MDTISDMITRIRNALAAKKANVSVIHSKQNLGILRVLKDEGYVADYKELDIRTGVKEIIVDLKYFNDQSPIREIKRVSKSSCRVYKAIDTLPLVYNGLGISILSTSAGILSDAEARAKKVGGEVICSVF